jgi:electron transport complex protein RnfE
MLMNNYNEFIKGIWLKNPILVLNLGLCPTLAVTTSVSNALWLALATTFVLVLSNILVSLVRSFLSAHIRITVFITIIAVFVTLVELFLHAFQPAVYESLGIYIPLIVVNCIILARAEEFASKNNVITSALDGLGLGIGFTLTLFVLATTREILGANMFLGYTFIDGMQPAAIMILAPGAFFYSRINALGYEFNKFKEKGKLVWK